MIGWFLTDGHTFPPLPCVCIIKTAHENEFHDDKNIFEEWEHKKKVQSEIEMEMEVEVWNGQRGDIIYPFLLTNSIIFRFVRFLFGY